MADPNIASANPQANAGMPRALATIDPADNPDLCGPLAPVHREIDVLDLPVVGKIPDDLRGVYLRNGPNPKFPPLGSYNYPYDGDGMIHGVWLADGKARYQNRYVMSRRLQAETAAGRALWGGDAVHAACLPAGAGSGLERLQAPAIDQHRSPRAPVPRAQRMCRPVRTHGGVGYGRALGFRRRPTTRHVRTSEDRSGERGNDPVPLLDGRAVSLLGSDRA